MVTEVLAEEVRYTIEPDGDEYVLVKHDEYGPWSVLAGQARRMVIEWFDSIHEATGFCADNDFAPVEILDHSTKSPFPSTVSQVPPSWFDPTAAGEVWSEEDY